MLTIKKIALVGVAAFAAFSISCSDDKKDDEVPFGFSWSKEVSIGGKDNTTLGSSLDIDDNARVYKASEVAAVKDKIDIVFDGQNVYTPAKIATASIASLSDKFVGVADEVVLFEVPVATETAEELAEAFTKDDASYYDGALAAANGKKFGVLTTEGNLALVVVNSQDGTAQVLVIKVDRTTGE